MNAPSTTTLRLLSMAGTLALAALNGCGGAGRDANAPLSAEASKVIVKDAAPEGCKKLGSAIGKGRNADEGKAKAQALDGAKEQAVRLGGDTIVLAGHDSQPIDGAGGVVAAVTDTYEVWSCPGHGTVK